ncbi:MAG: anaerobic carbon-monoxide dehydrogenase catalytic subunit [Dehalobacter sp. 4CP]|uniref:anaerobic carbon-monoxide dehydrogenase catalytic subunit n=1 Tax=Dehalobacter sp. CP TaxID=2594474 RepID=UPI0013CB6115|nr:anaerobic carbon-monoxide dehydrogenase catalytic subunit [Dehalobacter sp.]NBJ16062.1 anaerobic carbon-monoxide dehydrogenase catalytic subunit [Dehalobacter sp. 4CP]
MDEKLQDEKKLLDETTLSVDLATQELYVKARNDGSETLWDRKAALKNQCGFGEQGVCCRICTMGPCRVSPIPGKGVQKGICGATADVIASRHYARMVAGGSSAHSDHGRHIAHVLHMASPDGDYQIRDEKKLLNVAARWGVATEGKDIYRVAHEVAEAALNDFGKPFGSMVIPPSITKQRLKVWEDNDILPDAIDKEVVSIMHATHMGCTADAESMINLSMRTSLTDGWGGSYIGTEFSDIIFGTPMPREIEANMGVIEKNMVNIVLHGHEPSLSEMIVIAADDPELKALAKSVGAEGINLVGICCTGNEVAMRHGIKIAGNFNQQELAIVTGAVEAMIVDVQCIFPALANLAQCYHTKFITTSRLAKIKDAVHIEFDENNAYECAKRIIRKAVENYTNRKHEKVSIPTHKSTGTIGYSNQAIIGQLDRVVNSYTHKPGTFEPLAQCLVSGVLRGAAGVVGCNNPKVKGDHSHIEIIKKMLANDVIVVVTGCAAQAAAKAGLLSKDAVKYCGVGLQKVCELADIPPVLHMGSCVDNSRILELVGEVAKILGLDMSELPVVGAAPEWMSEKAIAIGTYVVSSGIDTFLGVVPPVTGSPEVTDILTNKLEDWVGAKFYFETDPAVAAEKMLARIEEKRAKVEALNVQRMNVTGYDDLIPAGF